MAEASEKRATRTWIHILVSVIVCLGILGWAIAALVWIYKTEPAAKKIKSTRKSAALVETIRVQRATFSPNISVLGTVRPVREISLSPRISGEIISLTSEFVPGGTVKAGDILVRFDPTDFNNALAIRKSELEQVQASLKIEEGRQILAQQELELLQDTIKNINRSLVLREPQIASIRAEVSAAQASVERATIDLKRTEVRAPFDAQILDRSVNVGSQVSPGDEMARLVGIDQYWVIATVPIRSLRWIQFPQSGTHSSNVVLRNSDTWPPGVERKGKVSRLIGNLDTQTRLARVLITVTDPLGLKSDVPPLILDSLVETHIQGRPLENVVRLEREFVRDQDTVWVKDDDQLKIKKVAIVFRDANYAYIQTGLESGDQVVVTNLATVADGIRLRKIKAQTSRDDNALEEGTD